MSLAYYVDRVLRSVSKGRARFVAYQHFVQPVPIDERVELAGSGKDVRIANTRADLPAVLPRPEGVIAQRFKSGSICFYLEKGGSLRGFLWLHLEDYEEDEVRVTYVPLPRDGTAWDYDIYVDPQFRLGRTFYRLWQAAIVYLQQHDVRWCHSRISFANPTSRRVHESLGAQCVGWSTYLTLNRLQLLLSSLPPYVNLSLLSRPQLLIDSPSVGVTESRSR